MKRPEKEAVIAELTDKFRNADAIYLTEYRGLTVPQISDLREKLGRDTSYAVAKNTLARIAAKEAGINYGNLGNAGEIGFNVLTGKSEYNPVTPVQMEDLLGAFTGNKKIM